MNRILIIIFIISYTRVARGGYQGNCGIAEPGIQPVKSHIIGGSDVTRSWPWMASLQFYNEWDMTYDHVCGASLLSKEWLLTAAHCVDVRVSGPGRDDPDRYIVMIGGTHLYSLTGDEVFVGVKAFYVHEDWLPDSTQGYPNDIALVHLDTFLDPVSYAAPICLPEYDEDFLQKTCYITGWGYTEPDSDYYPDVLQEAATDVTSLDTCKYAVPLPVLTSHICTGGSGPPTICNGDSGGPLQCLVGDIWVLAGVNSWTYNFCEGHPSVHTRITSYLEWLKRYIT